MYTFDPFIAPSFWINYSDIVMENKNETEIYKETLTKLHETKNCIVIFVKTEFIHYFTDILFSLEKPFILITGDGGDKCPPFLSYPVNNEKIQKKAEALIEKPELIFWFAKNPCIIHSKISAFPIGPKWHRNIQVKESMKNIFNSLCTTPKESLLNRSKKPNLLFFNFNVETTRDPFYKPHKNIRSNIKTILSKNFTWINNQPFEKYMQILNNHKFCVSPPGNGIDTHRCWEALMMGTIPLLVTSPIDYLFDRLPVIIVDDWNKITPEYLMQQYEIILKNVDQYDFSSLYTDYWINLLSSKKI
tara:strand:+ start:254 stop:1162 length:909 start_codon:yes stop_codon:yes gene_type:complete